MPKGPQPKELLIRALEERAKELNCLYKIEDLLNNPKLSVEEIIYGIIKSIPSGFQYSDYCQTRIVFDNDYFEPEGFVETPWTLKSNIKIQNEVFGSIEVFYSNEMTPDGSSPFQKEEQKLIDTVAARLGMYILHHKFTEVFLEWQSKKDEELERARPEWKVVLDLLKGTDHHTFSIVSRKMINHLFFKGIEESKQLFTKLGTFDEATSSTSEVNRPSKKQVLENSYNLGEKIFKIAAVYLSDEEIISMIHKWINEEKSHFLVKALANHSTPLTEIYDAVRRYYHINPNSDLASNYTTRGIRVSLIRRFLTDQLEFINIAKNYCNVIDFYKLLQNIIFPAESHGKLGGKSSGLFLAKQIIAYNATEHPILKSVKTPKTWYITSDALANFVYYNNLEEVIEQRYKDIDEIRQEYPHIIQAFKNSTFPSDIENGISRALDNFGDSPVIVRSSSLLEDRMGSAFAGKYKSLFLANQGTKQERMEAMMDAIAEVYASVFGPDPIGYRLERGLLDFNEEMGIMIQEVVGERIGDYFFPSFAGVAFSHNEFRWSPRIKREDGLIRMVPGLGTRAVDRIGSEYPILIAPGQPDLRVNLTFEEVLRYSPKNIDVINLKTNMFETITIDQLIKDVGNSYPKINEIFSIQEENHLKRPVGLGIDTKKHWIVPTFENLVSNSDYINKIRTMLNVLKENIGVPVDVEFACDGKHLYLLQCRPQSSSSDNVSAVLPHDISPERIIFTANRYVSNGKVPDIDFIVYVDPDNYSKHKELEELKAIGEAVGKLNKKLPRKKFILMGPGRWGSRDDIRLGVKVTYSEINNTAVLIEIAKQKGNYVPDLSFGTHFFQDLVESSIRYLPLYPDEEEVVFNYDFFNLSENSLNRFLPEYNYLRDTIKVINVPEATKGKSLRILMNAEEDSAMAILANPSKKSSYKTERSEEIATIYDEPWEWRMHMSEVIASKIDYKKYGIKGMYVFGTTFNESANSSSDIDILVHLEDGKSRSKMLASWFEGWNYALMEVNYQKTGYKVNNILDINYVTDKELDSKPYFKDVIDTAKNLSKKLKFKNH